MGRFVTLAKAAQIAGISTKELLAEVESGKIAVVRGMIHIDDLADVHPDADMDTADMVSWVAKIKQDPFQHIEDKQVSELNISELRDTLHKARAELAYQRDRSNKLESVLKEIGFSLQEIKQHSSQPNKIQGLIAFIEQKLSH